MRISVQPWDGHGSLSIGTCHMTNALIAKLSQTWSKGVFRDFLIYSFGTFLEKGVTFLLVPFYTRVMSPAEYGTLDTLLLSVWFTGIIMTLGLPQLINYLYFRESVETRFTIVQNLMGIYVWVCSPLFILGWPILNFLLHKSGFGQVTFIQTLTVMGIAYLSFFDGMVLTYCRLERKTVLYISISIAKSTLVILSTGLFVIKLKLGITGGVMAVAIGSLFGSMAWGVVYLKKAIGSRFPFRREIFFEYIKTGLPLVPSALLAWALLSVDRYLLNINQGAAAVGIYSTANKFASIFEFMVLTSLSNAYSPKAMSMYRENGLEFTESYNRKSFLLYLPIILLVSAVFLIFLYPIFPLAVGAEFRGAWKIIPLLLIGKILYTAHMFFVTLIMYEKKVKMVLAIYALTLIVSVSSNAVLIPRFSSIGAASTFCITNLFFTGAIFAANRFYRARATIGAMSEAVA